MLNQFSSATPASASARTSSRRKRRVRRWRGFSTVQLAVILLATAPAITIAGAVVAQLVGAIATDDMVDIALAAGENPGMIIFGAMFLASPIQWLTGRSQIRVRKYLGVTFFLLAVSNATMFAIERGIGAAFGAAFLIAGVVALVAATPLFLTSTRRAQRSMGMRAWRRLHKLTYLVAIALLAHVILLGDAGLGAAMITAGFVARIPVVRRLLERHTTRTPPAKQLTTTQDSNGQHSSSGALGQSRSSTGQLCKVVAD